jgi:hypothetical protein
MKTLLLAVTVLLLAACLAGCGEASSGPDYNKPEGRPSDDILAEPRRVPKPKTCSDYANSQEILLDERVGKLTKADKQWLDMDGDGRYCEERGVAWKGERSHTE